MSEFVKAMDAGLAGRLLRKFNEDEPRDEGGKWTEGGGGAGAAAEGAKDEKSHGEAAKYHAAQAARAKSEGRHEAAKQHDRAARSHALAASVHHDTKRFFAPADKETATRATANAQRNSQWAHADDKKGKFAEALMLKYSEDQERDEAGRFSTSTGGGHEGVGRAHTEAAMGYRAEREHLAAEFGRKLDAGEFRAPGGGHDVRAMEREQRLSSMLEHAATAHQLAAQGHATAAYARGSNSPRGAHYSRSASERTGAARAWDQRIADFKAGKD